VCEGLCAVGGRSDVGENRAVVYSETERCHRTRLKDDIHRQLDIALTQPSDDSRKHIRREVRTLYPTTAATMKNQFCHETSLV
jgi:hypothetical protein